MDKSPDAYRTISEVADELGLPQHVLRFWETRFPQIKPLKRGGGRRYYKPDDIDLVRGIQTLLYSEGYTIKGVQRILKEDGVKPVQMVGRGSPFTGERPTTDEADDDVVTDGEIDTLDVPGNDLRAARTSPKPDKTLGRKEPVLAHSAEQVPNLETSAPSLAETARTLTRSHKKSAATPDDALQRAFNELQECARLIGLMREKA